MGVRRESKHEVIEALRRRYRGAGQAEKGRSIDKAAVTGYNRRYAQALLRKGAPLSGPRLRRGGRPRVYGCAVEQALAVAAEATGGSVASGWWRRRQTSSRPWSGRAHCACARRSGTHCWG